MKKELSAGWLVEMFEHISGNPQFIVNGFIHSGISGALDDKEEAELNTLSSESHSSDELTDSDKETDDNGLTDSEELLDIAIIIIHE